MMRARTREFGQLPEASNRPSLVSSQPHRQPIPLIRILPDQPLEMAYDCLGVVFDISYEISVSRDAQFGFYDQIQSALIVSYQVHRHQGRPRPQCQTDGSTRRGYALSEKQRLDSAFL